MAASWALAYHCLLRTHEFVQLRVQDVVVNPSLGRGVVQLHNTKYGARQGTTESCTIDCSTTAAMASRAARGRMPGDPLMEVTDARMRSLFREACDCLGLADLGFRPYSLRRGGATFDFRSHGQLSRTVVRGRWNNARTARIYINEGVGMLTQLRLPPATELLISNSVDLLKATLISSLADG